MRRFRSVRVSSTPRSSSSIFLICSPTAFMAAMEASAGCFSRFSLATSSDPFFSSWRSCSTWLAKARRCSISVRSSIPRDIGATGTKLFPDGIQIVA